MCAGSGPAIGHSHPSWPCDETTFRAHAFSEASEAFIREAMATCWGAPRRGGGAGMSHLEVSAMSRVSFLRPKAVGHPATQGATQVDVWIGRMRGCAGRLASRLRVPGAIRNVVIKDEVTGQQITVNVGTLFIVVSIAGRDYYFHRFTGRFDGTGVGCCR